MNFVYLLFVSLFFFYKIYVVNPDVCSSETGTSISKRTKTRAGESEGETERREIIIIRKLYMMQKQTHSKHHLSVIIAQRDYSCKDSFYFISFYLHFSEKERERESENKRAIQMWQWDRERDTEIMLWTARCELICIVAERMKRRRSRKNWKKKHTNTSERKLSSQYPRSIK